MLHLFSCYSTNKCHAPLQNLIYRAPVPGSYCLQQLSWRVNFFLGKGRRPDCSPSQEQIQTHAGCCVLGAKLAQQRLREELGFLKVSWRQRLLTGRWHISALCLRSSHTQSIQSSLQGPASSVLCIPKAPEQGVLRDPVHWRCCQWSTNSIIHNPSAGLGLCSASSVWFWSLEKMHDGLSFLKQLFFWEKEEGMQWRIGVTHSSNLSSLWSLY